MQQTFTDVLGYVAAGLVFATFCAQRMPLLRTLAIASNVAFIGYGFLDGLLPILILHSAMLPVNVRRYRQSVLERRPHQPDNQIVPIKERVSDPVMSAWFQLST